MIDRLPGDLQQLIYAQLGRPRDLLALERVSRGVREQVMSLGRRGAWYRAVAGRVPPSVLQALPAHASCKIIVQRLRALAACHDRIETMSYAVHARNEKAWREAIEIRRPYRGRPEAQNDSYNEQFYPYSFERDEITGVFLGATLLAPEFLDQGPQPEHFAALRRLAAQHVSRQSARNVRAQGTDAQQAEPRAALAWPHATEVRGELAEGGWSEPVLRSSFH